jgi:divalent metal cation (Fe/Co/Zn/Cd) transporter
VIRHVSTRGHSRPPTRHSVRTFLKFSVLAALATIALKTAAWWVTGSVGLLSDAMESFVNLAAALFALAMVSIAQAPADDDHPYGHNKAEYFSSGFEAMMILGASLAIVWAAVDRWRTPQPLEGVGLGVALSIASSGWVWHCPSRVPSSTACSRPPCCGPPTITSPSRSKRMHAT